MSEFERFRGSSKFFLAIWMPYIFVYLFGHIWKMIKTDGEKKVSILFLYFHIFIYSQSEVLMTIFLPL